MLHIDNHQYLLVMVALSDLPRHSILSVFDFPSAKDACNGGYVHAS